MFTMFGCSKVNKYLLAGIITLSVLVADQLTKFLIKSSIPLNKSKVIIDGFFNITHIRNTGGAFSILSGMNSIFFTIASLIALLIIVIYLVKAPSNKLWLIVSLSLISGGAIGNMLDRVRLGEVVDFVDVFYKGYHWPAFNIADSVITIGVIMLFIDMVLWKKDK